MIKNKKNVILFAILVDCNLADDDFDEIVKVIPENKGKIVGCSEASMVASFNNSDEALEASLELQDMFNAKKVKTRMGLHFTNNIQKNLNIAEKLAIKAENDDVLLTEDLVNNLAPHLRSKTSFISKIIGNDNNPINIYVLDQRNDDNSGKKIKLLLSYKNQETMLIGFSDYVIGSRKDCDLVIADAQISEYHAVITRKKDDFIINDTSEQGTYIKQTSSDEELFIKNKEFILSDTGSISLGGSLKNNQKEIIKYKVIKS